MLHIRKQTNVLKGIGWLVRSPQYRGAVLIKYKIPYTPWDYDELEGLCCPELINIDGARWGVLALGTNGEEISVELARYE